MQNEKPWRMSKSEVLNQYQSSENGLTQDQVNEKLEKYGHNEISKKKVRGGILIFIEQFKNPLVLILIGASIIAAFLGELTDALIIISIVMLNGFLGFYQEYKSEQALEQLKKFISFTASVRRNGEEQQINTRELVPGDIVRLEMGDVVPADIRLLDVDDLTIDESSLTGESYPVRKVSSKIPIESPSMHEMKNIAFMGTNVKSGTSLGIITTTGKNTFFGKTAQLLKKIKKESEFQKSMKNFGYVLIKIVLISVIIIIAINLILAKGIIDTILFALALAVGMVPEALPIVITISLSKGAMLLAKKKVIVKRLVSVEDFGNIDVICSDKTGTLTENRLTLDKFMNVDGTPDEKIIFYSLLCNSIKKEHDKGNPIDRTIWDYAKTKNFDFNQLEGYNFLKEFPFDSNKKRMSVIIEKDGESFFITKGAPEMIIERSVFVWQKGSATRFEKKEEVQEIYKEFGNKGYRVIAVAFKEFEKKEQSMKDEESNLILLGFIAFIDPPKETTKEAIEMCKELGVDIKILTGDGPYISKEIAHRIGLFVKDEEIVLGQEIDKLNDKELQEKIRETIIISRATPEHKYRIVKALRSIGRVTACLGDGVNDAPALKEADVGIAVDQGTEIAKDAADVILLEKDLKFITDGIREGRKIFGNIVKYLIYTIAGNFGDLYTVGGVSMLLHFLPLLPSQLILANFLTDTPTISISTDNVEKESLIRPRRWNINFLFKFSGLLGIISSIFDVLIISLLVFVFQVDEITFRTALFLEVVLSEILVLFVIRAEKFFLKSEPPSKQFMWASLIAGIITFAIIYLPINVIFEFSAISLEIIISVILVVIGYVFATELIKLAYYRNLKKPKIKTLSKVYYRSKKSLHVKEPKIKI